MVQIHTKEEDPMSILKRVSDFAGDFIRLPKDLEAKSLEANTMREEWAKVDEPLIPGDVLKSMRTLSYISEDKVRVKIPCNYRCGEYQGVFSLTLLETLLYWHNATGYFCSEGKTETVKFALKRAFIQLAQERLDKS
jgi:hypothetical protein